MRTKHISGIPIKFERVPSFSKRHGVREYEGYRLACYMSHSDFEGEIVKSCPWDAIPQVLFHCVSSEIKADPNKEAVRMERELEARISAIAGIIVANLVDLVVVSVFDTVITVVGRKMQCASMFTVEGHVKIEK